MFGGMSPPMIQNSINSDGVIVRHREYIADIQSSQNFMNHNLPINPGLTGTFPWLSQIANAFEQYRFRGLIFEFKSLAADALISGADNIGQGSVIMATQYNSLSPGFSNKNEMENYNFANSNKPSVSFLHPVECALYQTPNTPLYIRNGALPPNADERLYDLGNFNIATQGLPSDTGSVGELWATFEIEFFKPKYNPNTAEGLQADNFNSGAAQNFTTLNPFGTVTAGYYRGNLGCAVSYLDEGPDRNILIKFPPHSTEVSEIFLVQYSMITTTDILASNAAINMVNVNATQAVNAILPTDPNTMAGALYQFDNITAAAVANVRRIICTAFIEILAGFDEATPPQLKITGFTTKFGAQTLAGSRAEIIITKMPTRESWVPLRGPTNLTVIGTD